MHFVLKCMMEPEFGERELERPIKDDLLAGLENEISELFAEGGLFPDMSTRRITISKCLCRTHLTCWRGMRSDTCLQRKTMLLFRSLTGIIGSTEKIFFSRWSGSCQHLLTRER